MDGSENVMGGCLDMVLVSKWMIGPSLLFVAVVFTVEVLVAAVVLVFSYSVSMVMSEISRTCRVLFPIVF